LAARGARAAAGNAGGQVPPEHDSRGDEIQMLDSSIFRDQMTIRRVRLSAGLIMLCYLTLHLSMHALGNVSLEAMQWGTRIHDSSGTARREPLLSTAHSRSILLLRCTPFMPAGASVWGPAN
jgi:hypothetical protein